MLIKSFFNNENISKSVVPSSDSMKKAAYSFSGSKGGPVSQVQQIELLVIVQHFFVIVKMKGVFVPKNVFPQCLPQLPVIKNIPLPFLVIPPTLRTNLVTLV